MRRIDLSFTALKLPLDFLALLGAAVTAYALRYSKFFTDIRPILTNVPFGQYLTAISLFIVVWLIFFAIAGLYGTRNRSAWSELGRVILSSTAGIMVIIATVFFKRELATSRFMIIAIWVMAIAYAWVARLFLRWLRALLLSAHVGQERVVIIGQTKTAQTLVRLYTAKPALGFHVIKMFKTWNEAAERDLLRLRAHRGVDTVLLANPDLTKEEALALIGFAEQHHLGFRYLADLFAASFTNIEVTTDGGIPIIEVKRTPLDGWGKIAKRLFDVLFSGILLVLFSPLLLFTTIAIKLDSPGRILFSRLPNGSRTQRIGAGGRPFHYFKFRSMKENLHFQRYHELAHLDTRKGDPLVKLKDDPRVTRVGRFIRKWSIDELPELVLVFLGRMSLVGPRPHLPEEVEKYKPHHSRVLTIKPGITGMAQISGRSDLDFEEEVRLDTWYIENWSLGLDLYILLKTPLVVITHRGVEEGV